MVMQNYTTKCRSENTRKHEDLLSADLPLLGERLAILYWREEFTCDSDRLLFLFALPCHSDKFDQYSSQLKPTSCGPLEKKAQELSHNECKPSTNRSTSQPSWMCAPQSRSNTCWPTVWLVGEKSTGAITEWMQTYHHQVNKSTILDVCTTVTQQHLPYTAISAQQMESINYWKTRMLLL
jgi:hypothetical protein